MKFEYEAKPQSPEPLAYIDSDGYLRIKVSEYEQVILMSKHGVEFLDLYEAANWDPFANDTIRHFFEGDSLNMEF